MITQLIMRIKGIEINPYLENTFESSLTPWACTMAMNMIPASAPKMVKLAQMLDPRISPKAHAFSTLRLEKEAS